MHYASTFVMQVQTALIDQARNVWGKLKKIGGYKYLVLDRSFLATIIVYFISEY